MEVTQLHKLSYRLVVLPLCLFLGSLSKSTDSGKSIILQENVSKFIDINIATVNIDIDTVNNIEIRSNNKTIFMCRKDDVCNNIVKSNIFNITKTNNKILRVYFNNVVRNSPILINGPWQVCHACENGNICDDTLNLQVFVYAQLDYFNCTYYFDVDHNLSISCNIKNIFPQAVCLFDTKIIQYHHSQVPGDTTYFNSKCSVALEINKEIYQVKTTMYPNITGDITDIAYGINVTLSVIHVGRLNSTKKCFLEGNSTSIFSCRCGDGLLGNVTTDSNIETAAIICETTLNREMSQPFYCNRITQLSIRTTRSQDISELSKTQSTTFLRDLIGTSVSSQPPLDFPTQGTAVMMTSLITISIIVFTLLTIILLYRFVFYPRYLMSVRITKSYICLTNNDNGDEIDNTDIYHLFNNIASENDHYTTIDDLKKEKERQLSEIFYRPELTQNGDFYVLTNLRNAEYSMKLEKNWDLNTYEKI